MSKFVQVAGSAALALVMAGGGTLLMLERGVRKAHVPQIIRVVDNAALRIKPGDITKAIGAVEGRADDLDALTKSIIASSRGNPTTSAAAGVQAATPGTRLSLRELSQISKAMNIAVRDRNCGLPRSSMRMSDAVLDVTASVVNVRLCPKESCAIVATATKGPYAMSVIEANPADGCWLHVEWQLPHGYGSGYVFGRNVEVRPPLE